MPLIFYLANNCCLTLCFMKCPGAEIRFCLRICISESCWQSPRYHTLSWAPSRAGQASRHTVSPLLPSAAAILFQRLGMARQPFPSLLLLTPGLNFQAVKHQEGYTRVEKNLGFGLATLCVIWEQDDVEKLFNNHGPSKMEIEVNFLKRLSWRFRMWYLNSRNMGSI